MCLWLLQLQLHCLGLHWVEVYGASLNLLSLWEGVGYPLGGVLLRPPVAVRDGAVVLIGWYQTVGDNFTLTFE